jgi:hypothetical protein
MLLLVSRDFCDTLCDSIFIAQKALFFPGLSTIHIVVVVLPSSTYSQQVSRLFIFHLITLKTHTTVGRAPLDEGSARRRELYLTTYNTHNRQTPMPPVGFETSIPARACLQTYALGSADTAQYPYSTKSPLSFVPILLPC